jgi:hypothetical protein
MWPLYLIATFFKKYLFCSFVNVCCLAGWLVDRILGESYISA